MSKEKWMVYDSCSKDTIYHDSKEKAEEDYKLACEQVENSEDYGEHKVYLYKVMKEDTFEIYPKD